MALYAYTYNDALVLPQIQLSNHLLAKGSIYHNHVMQMQWNLSNTCPQDLTC